MFQRCRFVSSTRFRSAFDDPRIIEKIQQWLIGTHHGVSREQLPMYLDEFVFRHNRRRLPMAAFQTLLGLGSGRRPTPYDRIRGAKDLVKHGPANKKSEASNS